MGEMRWRVCGGCEDDGNGDGAADDGNANDGHLAQHESERKAPRNNAPSIISMRSHLASKSKNNKNCNDKHDPRDSMGEEAGGRGGRGRHEGGRKTRMLG